MRREEFTSWWDRARKLLGEVFRPLRRETWEEICRPPMTIPSLIRATGIFLIVAGPIAVGGALIYDKYVPGPDQPVPFSHRIHVSTKKLSCFFCHPYAADSINPGMPPVEKCLLCHNVIATKFEPINRIHEYYDAGKPIPWVRVSGIPDFVHFSHQSHLARGIDCGHCHGDIKQMDRVKRVYDLDMHFCIDCHWRNNAPDSCFTCHY